MLQSSLLFVAEEDLSIHSSLWTQSFTKRIPDKLKTSLFLLSYNGRQMSCLQVICMWMLY